jgi:hypothetical protein
LNGILYLLMPYGSKPKIGQAAGIENMSGGQYFCAVPPVMFC